MTGFDIVLVVVLMAFALIGLKHGSVWIISCLLGGFIGAFLVEYYQLPLAGLMGDFAGSKIISTMVLFFAGVLVAVVPGWIVGGLAETFCMGAFDKILGALAGVVAGLIAVTLAFMIVLPRFPSVERGASWRNSRFARPLCARLENFFQHPSRQRTSMLEQIKDGVAGEVSRGVNKTTEAIRETTHSALKKIKK